MKSPKLSINKQRRVSGFTVIELMISIAILATLAGLGIIIGFDFYRSYALGFERNSLISALQVARSRSLANIGGTEHGVYLESNRYVIFRGNSYESRNNLYDEVFDAHPAINFFGTPEITFSQLTGEPSATGNITLTNGSRNIVISVENEGRISW